MATETIDLGAEFEKFVAERMKSGRYTRRAQVYEAARSALLQAEADDDLDVEYVKQAIAEGEASGIYEGDVFADVRAELGLPVHS
jgi:putative addiction module CopG family antidote